MSTVVILGATSTIARALARVFAEAGHNLVVAGRDVETIDAVAADARVRYRVQASSVTMDALDIDAHPRVIASCLQAAATPVTGVILCLGYLGEQSVAQRDPHEMRRILDTNFTASVSLLERMAEHLEGQGAGFVCALSSVAGDRGRQSNYLYGAAKGGLTVYLQGLRNRLFHAGVHVLTVKPGFVDTDMTFGKPGLFLVASPESVAKKIHRAVVRRRDSVYVPGFWWGIMFIIRNVPEFVFKRARL